MKSFTWLKYYLFFCGSLIMLSLNGLSQSTFTFSLKQCIDSVQQESYLLTSDAFRTEAAQKSVLVAHTQTLPWFSGEAGFESRFLQPYSFGQRWATIHGDWSLGDFILKPESVARQAVITTQYQQEKTRLDIIGRVAGLYMSIIQKKNENTLLHQQRSLLEEHKKLTETLWKAGQRTQIDILRTESEIATVEEDMNRTVTEENKYRVELSRLLGFRQKDTLQTENIPAEKIISLIAMPPADTALLSENPAIKILTSEIQVTALSDKLTRAQQFPHLFLSSGYFNDHDPTGDGNYWLINAGISVPIFRFGSIKYQEQQTKAHASALEYQRYDAYRELSIHQQQVLDNMKQLKSLISIQQHRLDLAKQAMALAGSNYKAGLITNLEYLTLQQQVTNTSIQIEEVRLEYIMYLIEYYLVNNQVDNIKSLSNFSASKN